MLLMNGVMEKDLLFLIKKILKQMHLDIMIKSFYLTILIQENGNLEMNTQLRTHTVYLMIFLQIIIGKMLEMMQTYIMKVV